MSRLKMPPKGQSAAMMAALQAEHASQDASTTPLPMNASTLQTAASSPLDRPLTLSGDDTQPDQAEAHSHLFASRDDRLTFALAHAAEDEIAVVTVRVPASLNRYMDDFVARTNRLDPKHKYRKQDAVAEAFAAFYADHSMPPAPVERNLP